MLSIRPLLTRYSLLLVLLGDGLELLDALGPVWKSTSVSGAPDNSPLGHFLTMMRPSWLGRAARNRHRHAIEQASRRWRGTCRKILISTQVLDCGSAYASKSFTDQQGRRISWSWLPDYGGPATPPVLRYNGTLTLPRVLTVEQHELRSRSVYKSTTASGGQFFTKSFLGDGAAAVLARSSGEERATPRYRAGIASIAWRRTRRFSTNAP